MKVYVYAVSLGCSLMLCGQHHDQDLKIDVEPTWINLDAQGTYEKQFGNKWMLVGSITFRKKKNESIKIENLNLSWHGNTFDHICGSLYKKVPEKEFLAIEENLVCDSTWNQAEQLLRFNFQANRQSLGPITTFYIVLSIPVAIEPHLLRGHFSLSQVGLPIQLQEYTKHNPVNLAFHAVPSLATIPQASVKV